MDIGALEIWENLSCINWSSEDKTSVLNCILDVLNKPVKCFNIFFKVLKCCFWDLHFLENLLWSSCVFMLHLTSYKSRYNQSLVDVNDIERKIDSSWHGLKNRLLFTVELRQNDNFVHDCNKSLIFDVKMIENIVNSIKLILN